MTLPSSIESFTFKPQELIQLSVFYKNDQPTGFGITLTKQLGDLNEIVKTLVDNWTAMYNEEEDKQKLVDELIDQLEAIAAEKHNKQLPLDRVLIAVGNVWLLEHLQIIQPDQYNGLQLLYEL